MTRVMLIRKTGGPEALEWTELALPRLKRNEARVRHTAIGVNFIDVYLRTGLYPATLPAILGQEAAGVVEEIGRGVTHVSVGDRVAYTGAGTGSYAIEAHVPADKLVKLPGNISDRDAAAIMLKGLTAHYLLRRTYKVRKKDAVVIHAAAGGVGSIAVQWARALGAQVIAVVGTDAKAEYVRALGAHEVIVTAREDLVTRVKEITRGKGVPVVYDSVGRDTFQASLDCLRPLGLMVSYGNSSGAVPPFSALELSKRGSLFLTRPTLFHYVATKSALNRAARELFEIVGSGAVKIHVGQTYPLADAARAHADLEARRTTGSTVLIP
jgi:NADPH2:quinone reductase